MGLAVNIDELRMDFNKEIENAVSPDEIYSIKVKYLGKKGLLTNLLKGIGKLSPKERPKAGEEINRLRDEMESVLASADLELKKRILSKKEKEEIIDISLPGRGRESGARHPVSIVAEEIVDVFVGMGFRVALGPEVEDDYYNFEALNIPPDHPARDMQDTFYFDERYLLRTHTSPVQIRSMLKFGAPLRIVIPGRVYRRDSDPTHSPMFHQLEGLLVDEGIALSDLKGVLAEFGRKIFDKNLDVRFRPSYFPFTEPSMEMDVQCVRCMGRGCKVCKESGWLEILGSGMVHPKVLEYGGVDPKKYTGFAWGMGMDRVAMLKYGIGDLRLLFENDLRFIRQR